MITSELIKPIVKESINLGVKVAVTAVEVGTILWVANVASKRVTLKPWKKSFYTNKA